MSFATILRAHPLAAALIQSLDPPGELVGLHVVVRNLEAALTAAVGLFPPTPDQLLAMLGELRSLRLHLTAVTPVNYKPTVNALVSALEKHATYAFWANYEAEAYARHERLAAAIAFLQARGETVPEAQLSELRRGIADPARDQSTFARMADAVVERAHVASAQSKSRLQFGFDDEPASEAGGVFSTTSATIVVEAPAPKAARSLAASIGATFRRQLTNAGAEVPVGTRARGLVTELLSRTRWQRPCNASLLLLTSILMQQPAGAVVDRLQLAVLADDAVLPEDGIWRLDPERGLLAVPVVGRSRYWNNDGLRDHFPDTDAATVLCVPESLLQPLRRLVGTRAVGPVFLDPSTKAVRALVIEMRAMFGAPLSVRCIAGMLAVPLFQASEDLTLMQRLAGHDFGTSAAGGNYYAPTHLSVAGPFELGLRALGLTDAARPLPRLPEAWARRRAGARRLPSNADLSQVAKDLDHQLAQAKRVRDPQQRAERLTSFLAIHVAVLLLLAAGHRWVGSLGHLTRGNLCPAVGFAVFFDKPTDALHARRLVLLPRIVQEALKHWLDYCQWLAQTCTGPIGDRARAALNRRAPLLFLVTKGAPKPLTLRAISAQLGPLGTAVVKGGRCLLSTRLREKGVGAARVEAQLGHTIFGRRPFHAGNLEAPAQYLGPAAEQTDLLLREFGFQPAVGVPDRYQVREVPMEVLPPWSPPITQIEASADRLAVVERDVFERKVSTAMRALRRAVHDAIAASVAALPTATDPLDRRTVRAAFDALRDTLDGSAVQTVALARTMHAELHAVRRSGREVASLEHFEPSFPEPPWLGDQHLLAVHSHNACVDWLTDPKAKGGWATKHQLAARFVLLLGVQGIVATVADAHAVLRRLPLAETIDSAPGLLFVPVRWPGEDSSRHPDTIPLSGEPLFAALGVLRMPGATDIELQELERAIVELAHASPWRPSKSMPAGQIFAGIHRVACLYAEVSEPGGIAQRIQGVIGSRELPLDLMRSLLDGVAAAPPAPPEPGPSRSSRDDSESRPSTFGSYLRALGMVLRDGTPKALRSFVQEQDDPAKKVVAEVALRLTSLAGKRVRTYAKGSQLTFLWLVACSLLRALRGIDLHDLAACEEALQSAWFDKAPDPRRLVGIRLAAEVLEDWFLREPMELGELPWQRGMRRSPRALMPSPQAWAGLPVAFERLMSQQARPKDRAELGVIFESLVVQHDFRLRTGETGALEAFDLNRHEDVLIARVAPRASAVVKTPAALRTVEAPLSAGLEMTWQRRVTLRAQAKLFPRLASLYVGAADHNEVYRVLLGDWRLRRHDSRSKVGTSAHLEATLVRESNGWSLRPQPDARVFREESAALGHANERSTCGSYVHTHRLLQAMRGRAAVDELSLEAIGSLIGRNAGYVKNVHREAAGGERKGAGAIAMVQRLVRLAVKANVVEVQCVDPAEVDVALPRVEWANAELARTASMLVAGQSTELVARRTGLPVPVVTEFALALVKLSLLHGIRYLPWALHEDLGLGGVVPPTELRELLPARTRIAVTALPDQDTSDLFHKLLACVSAKFTALVRLNASDVVRVLECPLFEKVIWTLTALSPPAASDGGAPRPAAVDETVRVLAAARKVPLDNVVRRRRDSVCWVSYRLRAKGKAGAVRGPALVESLLVSLALRAVRLAFHHP